MSAPSCTAVGRLVAATCNGLLPLEYWFYAGMLLLVATLIVHLLLTDTVSWRGRMAAAFLGIVFVTFPFTAVELGPGVDSLRTEEQVVKGKCLELQHRIAETGCPESRDGFAVVYDNRSYDCIEEDHISSTLCPAVAQK